MKPIVSVIVPVYNCGQYLSKCLDSLICQTFQEWEAVVVNDGSRDNSLEIMRRYESRDSRFKVVDQLNTGVVKARSNALRHVKGMFLTFLDADDRFTPDALALMVGVMETESADVCVGGFALEWEQSGKVVEVNKPKLFNSVAGCFRYCMENGETFLAIKMFRAELFKRVVNIPENVIIQEDTIGLTQYLAYAKKAVAVNKSIYIYLKRAEGASSRTSSRHIESLIKVMEFLLSDRFAMTEPGIVYSKCANIIIHWRQHPVAEEGGLMLEAARIWNRIPVRFRVGARFTKFKASLKSLAKRILVR